MKDDEKAGGELSKTVVKRDGKVVGFDPAKIASAITCAGNATGDFAADEGRRIAQRLTSMLTARAGADAIEIEEIQDAVELALPSRRLSQGGPRLHCLSRAARQAS